MTDERLVGDLGSWLHDSDIVPPDSRMSASRVMAGVEVTPQLGRWWPPARLAGEALPAPALGARPAPRPLPPHSSPRTTKGVLSMFTATRVAIAIVVFTLVSGSLFLAMNLLPGPVEPPAVASTSPTAMPSPTPAPEPTASPEPEPTAPPEPEPTPEPVVSTAESTFASTRVLTELPPGSDPTSLVQGPFGTSVFIDRATDTVYEVGDDGYPLVIAKAGVDTAADMASPMLVVRGGKNIIIYDADGRGWWNSRGDQDKTPWVGPLPGGIDHTGREAPADSIDPATTVATGATHGADRYSVYLVEPETGDIITYHHRYAGGDRSFVGIDWRQEQDVPGDLIGLYADQGLWALTTQVAGRFREDSRRLHAELQPPPGGEPGYRFISGTGAWDGELWLYDAAGRRFVAFDKTDGSYLGSWAPGADDPGLGDVRGMYVEGNDKGKATVVTWLTPDGLMESAVSNRKAIRPAPVPHDGGLKPSARKAGERALEWSAGGVSMEADKLRIRTGGKIFTAPGEVLTGIDSDSRSGSLESTWYENDVEMRVNINMGSDGSNWWVQDIWTYDSEGFDWVYYEDLTALTRRPVGEALEGDLRLKSTSASRKQHRKPGSGTLRIDGLRLSGFPPDPVSRVRPAPLIDCEYVDTTIVGEEGIAADLLQGPGEPMEGIKGMTPSEAEALLEDLGYCYRFQHHYRIPNPIKDKQLRKHFYDGAEDLRCSAPEHGRIDAVFFHAGRAAGVEGNIATVLIVDEKVRDLPEPPPQGTDCLAADD